MPELPTTPSSVRYVAAIDGVLEISLLGSADLAFWQDKLRPAGLEPTVRDGKAECLLSATNAKFHGIRFRELSFSVFITSNAGSADRDGAYMAYAFNSLRLFAWIERTLFSTPYYYGQLDVQLGDSARVVAHSENQPVFAAEMTGVDAASGRRPMHAEMDGWSDRFTCRRVARAATLARSCSMPGCKARRALTPSIPHGITCSSSR